MFRMTQITRKKANVINHLNIFSNRTTKLSKMMSAYCDRAGKDAKDVRFMFGEIAFFFLASNVS